MSHFQDKLMKNIQLLSWFSLSPSPFFSPYLSVFLSVSSLPLPLILFPFLPFKTLELSHCAVNYILEFSPQGEATCGCLRQKNPAKFMATSQHQPPNKLHEQDFALFQLKPRHHGADTRCPTIFWTYSCLTEPMSIIKDCFMSPSFGIIYYTAIVTGIPYNQQKKFVKLDF